MVDEKKEDDDPSSQPLTESQKVAEQLLLTQGEEEFEMVFSEPSKLPTPNNSDTTAVTSNAKTTNVLNSSPSVVEKSNEIKKTSSASLKPKPSSVTSNDECKLPKKAKIKIEEPEEKKDYEEDELRRLHANGQIEEVVGSQSILSQELMELKSSSLLRNDSVRSVFSASSQDHVLSSLLSKRNDNGLKRFDSIKSVDSVSTVKFMDIHDENDNSCSLAGADSQDVLRGLDRSGALKEIVGSQSLLSQEIMVDLNNEKRVNNKIDHDCSNMNEQSKTSTIKSEDITIKDNIESQCYRKRRRTFDDKFLSNGENESIKHNETLNGHSHPCELIIHAAQTLERREQHQTQARTVSVSPPLSQAPAPSSAELAEQAASLSRKILSSPLATKRLLLRMALTRENPRQHRLDPPRGTVIPGGFFWGSYPALECLLRNHMAEYYDLSMKCRQSRSQQDFNNRLVKKIQDEAMRRGWTFCTTAFPHSRSIRDRIRCFFKTHIQNSKKRLNTMLKNPTKRANAKALIAHSDLMKAEAQENADIDESLDHCPTRPKSDDMDMDTHYGITVETVPIPANEQYGDAEDDENDIFADSDETRAVPSQVLTQRPSVYKSNDDDEQFAQNPSSLESSVEEVDDIPAHEAAQQVLELGFARLSQDTQVGAIHA